MRVLFFGGYGLLGKTVQKLRPNWRYPTHTEADICGDIGYLYNNYETVVNAAAFISPPRIEKAPAHAIQTNIIGAAKVTLECMSRNIRMVYISTDYVFDGKNRDYSEDSPVNPVNKYGWSKLGGECSARIYDKSLIIRTSFGPDVFQHPAAYVDQYTSRQPVSVFAKQLVALVETDITGILHVGGERTTVYEYASRSAAVGKIHRADMPFPIPADTSLNCKKFNDLHLLDGNVAHPGVM